MTNTHVYRNYEFIQDVKLYFLSLDLQVSNFEVTLSENFTTGSFVPYILFYNKLRYFMKEHSYFYTTCVSSKLHFSFHKVEQI